MQKANANFKKTYIEERNKGKWNEVNLIIRSIAFSNLSRLRTETVYEDLSKWTFAFSSQMKEIFFILILENKALLQENRLGNPDIVISNKTTASNWYYICLIVSEKYPRIKPYKLYVIFEYLEYW